MLGLADEKPNTKDLLFYKTTYFQAQKVENHFRKTPVVATFWRIFFLPPFRALETIDQMTEEGFMKNVSVSIFIITKRLFIDITIRLCVQNNKLSQKNFNRQYKYTKMIST
jgi:hypothetical protein